ncbi:type II secretion system protein [Aliivibrio fischeri]|uniref:Type IV pilus, mannose-sensitive hemagglutinin A n=1 Tax=Aliivibrio fischeri SR5 TaxID=1088719 RepID=A0AAV3EWL0_ALIFS|nr:type II secretion system protein [Aliivibrio fischeri]EHN71176.1 type IV pilus, mannose-sensitive hemagglutinin A [Aliivibrio fischeri SR5]
MKRQGGFTLIELVVVIVILGILAVTAAPKFLNLQSDARTSSLQGLKGAMAGAAGIVYGKSAIDGKETAPVATVDDISVVYGYPAATSAGIAAAVVGLSDDWNGAVSNSAYVVTFKDSTKVSCYVSYATNASASAPTITVISDDC